MGKETKPHFLDAIAKDTVEEMMEEQGLEECAALMVYLQKYYNEWGCKISFGLYRLGQRAI